MPGNRHVQFWSRAAGATPALRLTIRIAGNTYVTLNNGWYGPIQALGVKPDQRRYYQQVWLTQDRKLLTNLSVTWTPGDEKHPPELLALISDQPAARARLREYAVRMHIEESFRDDKSGGFDMAHTRLHAAAGGSADRLERLLLALATSALAAQMQVLPRSGVMNWANRSWNRMKPVAARLTPDPRAN